MTTTLYNNAKLNPLTFSSDNKSANDLAHEIWYNKLNAMQRLEVMGKVHNYKNMAHKLRACLNYISENLSQY